ncbi:MAG: tRNA 4-thiouridine(8) synthase ThiI [Oscillospiraceae bacterium]|nr:tRNA 4-thiouridine(8) synthase ThiI [Oscillospiraceae bacterium]
MREVFLLKMGELVLKGLNRQRFEQRLMSNLKRRISPFGNFNVYSMQSTIYAEPAEDADIESAFEAMRRVFGVAAVCRCAVAPKNMEAITASAIEYLRDDLSAAGTFKVEAKRSDKAFVFNSPQICAALGESILNAYSHLRVDVHAPQTTVVVEVRDMAAFVHAAPVPGAGGLPVGTGGRAVLLLSGGIDSPVAGYMMAKRGLEILPVHFFSYPYTGAEAKDKVLKLADIMSLYTGRAATVIVPFTEIQERIRKCCPEDMMTVITRRFMMRIAERIALDNGCGALITGESLGQVASQTMEAMAVTQAVCTLPVLRPLVGMDKEEVVAIARKIGTFDTSVLPYEDCCTLFTPKHPKTRPTLAQCLSAEEDLDIDGLVQNAVEGTASGA